jgi:predicted TIM-barrel fold metal-dependent hydrolase
VTVSDTVTETSRAPHANVTAGKIALEEHFGLPDFPVAPPLPPGEFTERMLDTEARLAEMDASGIDLMALSLGHLGETLPLAIWRLQNRFEQRPHGRRLAELGAERVLFAVDYPYEAIDHGAGWFDAAPLDDVAREQIGRENARRLLGL